MSEPRQVIYCECGNPQPCPKWGQSGHQRGDVFRLVPENDWLRLVVAKNQTQAPDA